MKQNPLVAALLILLSMGLGQIYTRRGERAATIS
jgi:TM2 domain-containing membrane protein YozV